MLTHISSDPAPVTASYRRLIEIALPLMLAGAAYAVLLFTDRYYLSQLGTDEMAAATAVGFIGFLLQSLFVCTAAYASTFVAQHFGAGEHQLVGAIMWPALWIVLAGSALCIGLIPAAPWIFALSHPTAAVMVHIRDYAPWMFLAALPLMVLSCLNAFFAGIGRTSLVMILNFGMCALNAGSNYLLIFGHFGLPACGMRGAGIGTLIAATMVACVAAVVYFGPRYRRRFATWSSRGWNRERMLRFLRFGLPQGFRVLFETAIWNCFQFAMGWLGPDAFVASGIVMTWNLLAYTALNGLNQAVAVVVGQAIGAGQPQLASAACHRALVLITAYVAAIFVVSITIPDALMTPFLDHEALTNPEVADHVRKLGRTLLLISAFWTLGDGITFIYMGALNGAGDTAWQLRMFIVLSLTLLVAPLIAVIAMDEAFWLRFGLEAVEAAWISTLIFLFVLAAVMALRFYRGRWRNITVRG
jgi:multidrug resistance protein, MATE family